MAEFSAADAAFTGFRVVRERPWAVAIWAVLQFVVSLGLQLFVAATAGGAMQRLQQMGIQSPGADPGPILAAFQQVAPTYAVVLLVVLVINAVFYAAMNRAVLRPAESRFGYLRLAADELRQLGLLGLLVLLFVGVYFALAIVTALVVALIGAVTGEATLGIGLALAILVPAFVCTVIYFGVRLSLASPLTFAGGRINLVGSWRLTQHRFWPLLGAYAIAFALSLVVVALIMVIDLIAVGIVSGNAGGAFAALQSDQDSVASVLTASRLVYLAIAAVGAGLSSPITMCPPAAIYRALTGGGAAVGRVFD